MELILSFSALTLFPLTGAFVDFLRTRCSQPREYHGEAFSAARKPSRASRSRRGRADDQRDPPFQIAMAGVLTHPAD
jgi:hypothetical protein